MDLSNAIAAEEAGSTETTTTTTTSDESEIPFESNESTEGYALFADSASLVGAISTEVFGNDPVYSLLEWGMDLEDYAEIVEENDLNGQQKLDLLHKLAKSTFGGRQSDLNEGYGMGWDTDESPPKPYVNGEVNHVPYLDVFSELPSFDHDTLDGGEIDQLESEGLDMDNFGFDRSIKGPQLPKINGERVPILFEEGDEVTTMLEMLNSINFDEVTYGKEKGSLQGPPTLGPDGASSEADTDKVAAATTKSNNKKLGEEEAKEINFAENPERVSEVSVNALKGVVTDIDSLRTIQTMLRVEKENGDRTSATDRLEQRRNKLQSSEEDDEEDDEEAEESESQSGMTDAEMNLISTLIDNGMAEDFADAKQQVVGE